MKVPPPPWQARVWYCDAEHIVHHAHWRLAVAVHADVWYCAPEQELHAAHWRLAVAVHADVWYVDPAEHVVHGAHWRLLVSTPPAWQAEVWYCDAEQDKQA